MTVTEVKSYYTGAVVALAFTALVGLLLGSYQPWELAVEAVLMVIFGAGYVWWLKAKS